ncbi:hypothetical protein LTR62_000643 [Meristemomyces frigidus]|uniref:Rad60/SUMO-like domain-containing protein n=1 Tax=Meristemomyces frigidus TaxID=1508187 RepID=A0AAN7TKB4_9PEZI|nr:hypothetical protein LTR62_000643 [Meristemomyces frigidus]
MSLFKRPAWASTLLSDEPETEEGIFSHRDSYKDIVADEQRRRQEREQRAREKHERKEREISLKREKDAGEDRKGSGSPKRRRITFEEGEDLLGSFGLPRFQETVRGDEDFKLRRSPRGQRTIHKLGTGGPIPSTKSIVIGLDNDPHDEDEVEITYEREVTPVEEDSDEEFAELARQARARNKLRDEAAKKLPMSNVNLIIHGENTDVQTPPPPDMDPRIQLLVTSRIPDTTPLVCIRKLSQRLQEIRHAWCKKQNFPQSFAESVYLVHKGHKVFDVTSCRSLGLDVDADGHVFMRGAEGAEGVEKVHLEAVTDTIMREIKAEKMAQEKKRQLATDDEGAEDGADVPPVEEEPTYRIMMISKHRSQPFKLRVKPSTTIAKIMAACRKPFEAGEGQTVTLEFDGEQLDPEQTVGDTEIDDMDRIDARVV